MFSAGDAVKIAGVFVDFRRCGQSLMIRLWEEAQPYTPAILNAGAVVKVAGVLLSELFVAYIRTV
jgi:hypothetical protein